jgi:tricarballylate dehydrogenase
MLYVYKFSQRSLEMDSGVKHQCDVVVVGAGNAALTAALAAREKGAEVLVVEKASAKERGGNSRFSGGLFRFAYEGLEGLKPLLPSLPPAEWNCVEVGDYSAERYFEDIMRVTRGRADPALARTLAEESYATVLWMTGLGIEWEWTSLWSVQMGGKRRFNPGSILEVKNKGLGLMGYLFAACEKAGIHVFYDAEMLGFLQDGGGVRGVQVKTAGGLRDIKSGAVVLASGGFEASAEMRVRYLGANWEKVKVRGTRHNTGETLEVALDLGAKPAGDFQGSHATPVDANAPAVGQIQLTDKTNRLSYPYSIMVNTLGRRFVDEGEDLGQYTYAKIGHAILAQPGTVAYQIFDQKTVQLLEERYSTGTPVVAETLEELAGKLTISPDVLRQTVEEFNAAVQPGEFNPAAKDGKSTRGLDPPKSSWALPIDTPPYTAYPVACGITFTYGGVAIDTKARVLDTSDKPIDRLYATGEITGGFFYYNYPGGAGLMRGAVFGRLAGTHAATKAMSR